MYAEIIDAYMAKQARELEGLREVNNASLTVSVFARISEKEKYLTELKALKQCFILIEGGTF